MNTDNMMSFNGFTLSEQHRTRKADQTGNFRYFPISDVKQI